MVFQIIQIKLVQKVSKTLLPFFEFVKEFLGVRPGLGGGSSTNMFLNLLPLLAMNFESFEKPKMLVLGPSASLVRQPATELDERRQRFLPNGLLLSKLNVFKVLS